MNKEKHVDESWKEQASSEKVILSSESSEQSPQQGSTQESSEGGQESSQAQEVEINFLNYITSLGFQAMIFLGEIPNPVTNKAEKNLNQAKFLIDTLSMLKDKTQGNLDDQEKAMLESSVYELQMKYVQVMGAEGASEENPS